VAGLGTMPSMTQAFEPSLTLNAAFYREVVAPIVASYPHAAALLGWGSDVLGYDTERSTDHGWGPRLQIFVAGGDVERARAAVDVSLPDTFRGWPVRFGWDAHEEQHRVDVLRLREWLTGQLGIDPSGGLEARDWLAIPQQQLLGVVRGAVFADPAGELAKVREQLAWYPHDVWLWLLACQWQRISQEEAFVGRSAEVGDELGSRLVAARLVRDLMGLAFLLERTYRPYSKWVGTAFARLALAGELAPILDRVLGAADYPAREQALVEAYETLGRRHNTLGVTPTVDPTVRQFHGRPFRVLMGDRFAEACRQAVDDSWLRSLPLVGSVDQFADSTDVLGSAARARLLSTFYDGLG
jgi:Domain of unknown function (DUF4037)